MLGLGTLRCWTINAGKVGPETTTISSAPSSRRGSLVRPSISTIAPSTEAFTSSPQASGDITTLSSLSSKNKGDTEAPLVVTLVVHVHPDSSDSDVMDITRLSWSKLSNAISSGRSEGEVSVQVKRGWEGAQ